MANEVQKQQPARPPMPMAGSRMLITNYNDLHRLAHAMVAGGIAPKGMTAEAACGVMAFGMELGLTPIQSLKDVAFINGKPCAYGDAVSGLINASGLLAAAPEVTYSKDGQGCRVVLRRRGVPGEFVGEYDLAKAKRADLLGKDNWKKFPERMLYWRAYSYAARDGFSDVLKGLNSREVVEDDPPAAAEVLHTRRVEPIDDIREVLREQPAPVEAQPVDAIAKDRLPNGEPDFVDAPTIHDSANFYAEWQRVSKVLKPKEVDEIRGMLGVSAIHPKLPVATLEQAVSLARELTKE
jgi:hypothetical protein